MARRDPTSARKGAAGRGGGRATLVLVVFLLVILAALAPPVCVLLAAGLLPSLAALILDRHRALYLTRAVGAMNLAGITWPALALWDAGVSIAGLRAVLENPLSWLSMYGGASLGWLVYLAIPPVALIWIEAQADDTRVRLGARAKGLVAEWGEEVTGRANSATAGGRAPPS
jgi:hypothetical protein